MVYVVYVVHHLHNVRSCIVSQPCTTARETSTRAWHVAQITHSSIRTQTRCTIAPCAASALRAHWCDESHSKFWWRRQMQDSWLLCCNGYIERSSGCIVGYIVGYLGELLLQSIRMFPYAKCANATTTCCESRGSAASQRCGAGGFQIQRRAIANGRTLGREPADGERRR